jgi:hypothetical protein
MGFILLLFFNALLLSSIAAYYSIAGLIAIFSAAPLSIAMMGGSLELAKLVTVSWLYRNWNDAPRIMKYYFTVAVVILMFITSLGIFGFLSKAHTEQGSANSNLTAQIEVIDDKIKVEKEIIDDNRKALKQLDEAVDQTMGRTKDEKGATQSSQLRKAQQKERSRISSDISEARKKIAEYNVERFPLETESRKLEAEVGPIKYIAALAYSESGSEDAKASIEKAVRFIIILLVSVFDPMAVLLVIAANYNMNLLARKREYLQTATIDPIPMEKKEVDAHRMYHRDQDSM